MARRLYYEDPKIRIFEAEVCGCEAAKDGRYLVTLDQTAFYPEGGGQPWDMGTLGGVRVLEVHEMQGEVVHTTDGPLEPGARVTGEIDWDRRFRNMQNHTGEHVFSGIIHRRFGWDNVGFHMGSDAVTIDFNGVVTPEQVREAEAEANRIVCSDVPVEITFPSPEELGRLDYRSKKELTGQVRIVTVPGGDVCACCGTHVERTGEIGLIKTTGMIHYKGGVRISMLCGTDALEDYGKRLDQVSELSHLLSAKTDEVVEAVKKLKEESEAKGFTVSRLYGQIFEARTEAMPESDGPVCLFEEGLSPVQLRQFCTMLYERRRGSVVAVCSGAGTCYQYALGSAVRDMRALSKELNGRLNGRGGGSSLMAQGMWNAAEEEIRAAILIDGRAGYVLE